MSAATTVGVPNSMILGQAVQCGPALVSAANSTFSGSSLPVNAVPIFAAPANGNGAILRRLRARPLYAAGSTAFTATQAQLLRYTGSALFLDDDATILAQTLSLAAATYPADFGYTDANTRYIPPGHTLLAGIGVPWTPGIVFVGDVALL